MIEIKQKRLQAGITQKELAQRVGMSKRHLIRIENGGYDPPEQTKEALEDTIDEICILKTDCRVEVLIDYVRIHFKSKNIRRVIEEGLRFPFDDMIREDRGFYGFSTTYRFGDMYVMHEPEGDQLYTLLELKGKGCRLFECHLEAIGWTWYDFFQHCFDSFDVRIKRLDLAIDDIDGILSIPMLKQKCRRGEWESVWMKAHSGYESGMKRGREDQDKRELMGETLYLGSLKSELYFCLYQKNYEQYKKHGIPLEDAPVKNRFEIRLKNDRAFKAMEDLVFRRDMDGTVFDIIHRYVTFVDYVDGIQVVNPRWSKFIGADRSEIKLSVKPEPYTVERTKKWFQKQVAPSLNLLLALDDMEDTSFVPDTLGCASLSENHMRVLKQVAKFKQE